MNPIMRLWHRAFPALLLAISVVLLSAGLFAFAPPVGDQRESFDPADPGIGGMPPTAPPEGSSPSPVGPTDAPDETLEPGETPTASPATDPTPLVLPSPPTSPTPAGSPATGATPTPGGATPTPPASPGTGSTPRPGTTPRPTIDAGPTVSLGNGRATRIVVPSLNIDLPVVSGDLVVRGNRDFYPLCDVAQYMTSLSRPGQKGTSYIYAHARKGMFLPLLEASKRNNGSGMIGSLVEVYTSDNRLHLYEIYKVKRHATDLSLAYQLPREGRQLIMQTSEGPRGTRPKLQVAARPIGVVAANPRDASPVPRPRPCG